MSKITGASVFIPEGSAAATDVAGSSQIWTKSDVPSSLYHTDDAGTDHRINGITLSAEQATTSGSAYTFSSIPAGTKIITIMLVGVSFDGSSDYIVTIGNSGGLQTSGYTSSAGDVAGAGGTGSTTAFRLTEGTASSSVYHGNVVLTLEDSANFTWTSTSHLTRSNAAGTHLAAGSKSLSGELTQLSFTTAGGSDSGDAGSVSIQYQ